MSKRFTETNKWSDPWYRNLTVSQKCLWGYLCDNCDQSGVIDLDIDLAAFQIGAAITRKDIDALSKGIKYLSGGKLWIHNFIQFQYGKLSEECKPHKPVFACLKRNGIDLAEVEQNYEFKETVPTYIREQVIQRDGLICAYYGVAISKDDVEIDHVVPRAKGGKCTLSNLVVACREANNLKRDLTVEEFCEKSNLNLDEVFVRINERVSKPFKAFQVGIQCLQEKEKDKETDKDKGLSLGLSLSLGGEVGAETGQNGENAKESVLSPVDEPDHVRVEPPPVKTPIKPKDELFEALCRETNIEWQTLTQIGRGAANKALAQIRQASPEVTPEMIRIRVSNLKDMFPKATVTPMSLAKYWAAAAYEPGQLPAKIQADRERRKAAYSA